MSSHLFTGESPNLTRYRRLFLALAFLALLARAWQEFRGYRPEPAAFVRPAVDPRERDGDRWRFVSPGSEPWYAWSTPTGRRVTWLRKRADDLGRTIFVVAGAQLFTASGTFTATVTTTHTFECLGGGQAGTNGTATLGRGGGIGGDYALGTQAMTAAETATITVGIGGTTSAQTGLDSKAVYVPSTTTVALAKGGNSGTADVGTTTHTGGTGGSGNAGNGGGGGGGAGATANGTNGSAASSTHGGAAGGGGAGGTNTAGGTGGTGADVTNQTGGVNGTIPGGGGGGGSDTGTDNLGFGTGARGQVYVTWSAATPALFRAANLSTGAGGPFFANPVG